MKKHYYLENIIYFLGRSLSRTYAKICFKKKISLENKLPKGAKIFAVNHPSTLDPLYVMGAIKEPVHAMLTETVFKIFGLSKIIIWAGHVNVEVKNRRNALEQAIQLLNKNRSILIFPEGVVSKNSQKVGKLRTGLARMALATGAPIIPIGIHLDPKKVKRTTITVKGKESVFVWYRRGAYTISYGKAIYLNGQCENRNLVKETSVFLQAVLQNLLLKSRRLTKLPIAS